MKQSNNSEVKVEEQPPTSAAVRCAVCHQPLLMPPIGKRAGLCPGVCAAAGQLDPRHLRDFVQVVNMRARKDVTVELEPETLIWWIAQVPPKPPVERPIIYEDDGSVRYRNLGTPLGVDMRAGDVKVQGLSPQLDKFYRDDGGDNGNASDGE